jgi:hypothetical protein
MQSSQAAVARYHARLTMPAHESGGVPAGGQNLPIRKRKSSFCWRSMAHGVTTLPPERETVPAGSCWFLLARHFYSC